MEIQVTADWLGVSLFTFHDGRWLKYSCSSKCLSEECIYLENIRGDHFECVVCVCKPGLQSCYGYCKVTEETGYSTRSKMIGVVDSDVAAVTSETEFVGSEIGDCIEVVEGGSDSTKSKYLRRLKSQSEIMSLPLREKRQLRIRKMYSEDVMFREKAKLSSVEKYLKNIPHRERVKAISIGKYRDDVQHRDKVRAMSIGKYRDDVQHRDKVRAMSIGKYKDDLEHRVRVKAGSKASSKVKYRDNIQHREKVKAMIIGKYKHDLQYRDRTKSLSKVKYRDSVQHREKSKKKSKRQYRDSLKHRQQVIACVRLSRKQRLEKSEEFGFVMK